MVSTLSEQKCFLYVNNHTWLYEKIKIRISKTIVFDLEATLHSLPGSQLKHTSKSTCSIIQSATNKLPFLLFICCTRKP